MSAYIHGSLALEERQTKSSLPVKKQPSVAAPAPRPKTMTGSEKLLWLGLALLSFTILGLYQYREAAKYEMNAEIVKIEAEVRALEEENAQLVNDIAKLGSPDRLIEKGIQLGLIEQGMPSRVGSGGTAVASAE